MTSKVCTVYIHACVSVCMFMFVNACMFLYACMYEGVCACVDLCVCACVCVCKRVLGWVGVCVYAMNIKGI